MRVRHLQSHLSEQSMIYTGNLEQLHGMRMGFDGVFWLRTIQGLKDPFADAIGGIPPGIFGFVDRELENFKRYNITPFFVFQGITPTPQHQMFQAQHQTMDEAWDHLSKGNKQAAQKVFAVSTSRINSDVVYFIIQHLRVKGYDVYQAPYFAGSQIAHFAEMGLVQGVFGTPGLLLYGVHKVIISLDFTHKTFEWVDFYAVLNHWSITREQFVEACMLAGTEYCLTYPFLNLDTFHSTTGSAFKFDVAVDFIRQFPLLTWMETFPTNEMREDHLEGYCVCKTLVQHGPILNVRYLDVSPPGTAPCDLSAVFGRRLPNPLYLLLCQGIISHKLPSALAMGEWCDKTAPFIDTYEFRQLLMDLMDYRERALGLITCRLGKSFHSRQILWKYYFDEDVNVGNTLYVPEERKALNWQFNKEMFEAEIKRQGATKIDFRFCLQWHTDAFYNEGVLCQNLAAPESTLDLQDTKMLTALVHFKLLEAFEFISDTGGLTVLGNVLKNVTPEYQEPMLVALETMKLGILSGDPFDPPEKRSFPSACNYPVPPIDTRTKSILLLSRVIGLVPMRLKDGMWDADIDFDLAAWHSLIRVVKRTIRHMAEGCVANVLLKDLSKAKLAVGQFMPDFLLPRACLGIVLKYLLLYSNSKRPHDFRLDVQKSFPCARAPIEDLKKGVQFWDEMMRALEQIAAPLNAMELYQDIKNADLLLKEQLCLLG